MNLRIITIAVAILAIISLPAPADVLLLESIQDTPVNSAEGVPRPTRGLTMEQVRERFGPPATEHPWIGDPPITRWDFADYSVFFEHQHVLTSVVHR